MPNFNLKIEHVQDSPEDRCFTNQLLVCDGAGLVLHDGTVVKFKDVAQRDDNGAYVFPPENSKGGKLPYIEKRTSKSKKQDGSPRHVQTILVTPLDSSVRYRNWTSKNFCLSIRDILRFLCVSECDEFRAQYAQDEFRLEGDYSCRECIHYIPVNNHPSVAVCGNNSRAGEFRAGSSPCKGFKKEWIK